LLLLIKQIAEPGRRRKNQVTFWEYPRYFLDVASIFISISTPESAKMPNPWREGLFRAT
jgi:hypothetical protein